MISVTAILVISAVLASVHLVRYLGDELRQRLHHPFSLALTLSTYGLIMYLCISGAQTALPHVATAWSTLRLFLYPSIPLSRELMRAYPRGENRWMSGIAQQWVPFMICIVFIEIRLRTVNPSAHRYIYI